MTKQVVLIDAKNLVYATHWVHRFLSSKGRSTSVLYGGFNVLVGMAKRMPDTPFVFVWDGNGKTWRHRITKGEYKGNRLPPNDEMKPALEQIPEFRKQLDRFGFRQFCVDGFECDDLIGILTAAIIKNDLFSKVIIKSSDKDFYQLTTDRIGVMRSFDKEKGEHSLLFANDVMAEIELHPTEWVKVRALTGEKTDNIPQIQRGLGPKTAIKMIKAGLDTSVEDFKTLPWQTRQDFGLLATQWSKVRMNYNLSQIVRSWDDARIDNEEVRKQLKKIVNDLTTESFYRDPKKLNEEGFLALREFMLEYEMENLFEDRTTLWQMP